MPQQQVPGAKQSKFFQPASHMLFCACGGSRHRMLARQQKRDRLSGQVFAAYQSEKCIAEFLNAKFRREAGHFVSPWDRLATVDELAVVTGLNHHMQVRMIKLDRY